MDFEILAIADLDVVSVDESSLRKSVDGKEVGGDIDASSELAELFGLGGSVVGVELFSGEVGDGPERIWWRVSALCVTPTAATGQDGNRRRLRRASITRPRRAARIGSVDVF